MLRHAAERGSALAQAWSAAAHDCPNTAGGALNDPRAARVRPWALWRIHDSMYDFERLTKPLLLDQLIAADKPIQLLVFDCCDPQAQLLGDTHQPELASAGGPALSCPRLTCALLFRLRQSYLPIRAIGLDASR
jgi:hypothetical protein